MFIAKGLQKGNEFWKYLIGSFLMFLSSIIGQLPLLLALCFEVYVNGRKYPVGNQELMLFFDSNLMLFFMLLPFVVTFLTIYFVVKKKHNQAFLSIVTSRKAMDLGRFFYSFSIWAIFVVITTFGAYYFSPEDFILNFRLVPFLTLFVVATLLIPFQSSVEELIFRGYLMQGFAVLSKNKGFSLIFTSLIFGLMHYFNPEVDKIGPLIFVYYIGTGLFLGVLTLMDEGLELSLGFHAANNLFGALLVTSDWSALQTYSVFKDVSEPNTFSNIILPVFVFYPLLLFIFKHKYKWSNWQEKLTGKINI